MAPPGTEHSSSGGSGNGPGKRLGTNLRDRVLDEAMNFSEAFDALTADPTPENLDRVREAADRLMRAAGRVIIESQRVQAQQ